MRAAVPNLRPELLASPPQYLEQEPTVPKAEMKKHTPAEFVKLLDLCRIQAEADPEAVTQNPHLYRIYLRLCGGNIDENSIGEVKGAERERRLAEIQADKMFARKRQVRIIRHGR